MINFEVDEKQLDLGTRTFAIDQREAHGYARKTYRYLRVAIVAMLIAILISILLEWIDTGELLGSLSAYYFTPGHAIFIGSFVMIGVCLIAIRGLTTFEDIVLNAAGLFAPIVAFVPTGYPSDDAGYPDLLPDSLPIPQFESNNVLALAIAVLLGVAAIWWLGRGTRGNSSGATPTIKTATRFGFTLAGLAVAALLVAWWWKDSQGVHNTAAVGLVLGLLVVATSNAMRMVEDDEGHRSHSRQALAGFFGSLFVFGLTLGLIAVLRLFFGGHWWPAVAALVALVLCYPNRKYVRSYFTPLAKGHNKFCRFYLFTAIAMVALGPFFGLLPGEIEHRTFIVEIVELVPFLFLWVMQTYESWNPLTDDGYVELRDPTPTGGIQREMVPKY